MKIIHVNQVNENIEIQFRIMNGAQPFNVPEGVSCTIRGTKGDNFGYAAAVAVTAGSNIVTVTLTEQLTAVAGAGNIFELVFVGASDDMKVSTENFILAVERAALGEDTVISDSDLAYADQVLDQLQSVGAVNAQVQQNKANIAAETTRATAAEAAEASARQTADQTLQSNINAEASSRTTTDALLQAQIDQLIAPSGSAPSAAEVENARIGSDGTVYPTLGDAIRTQNSDLKSHLDNNIVGTLDYMLTNSIDLLRLIKWNKGSYVDDANGAVVANQRFYCSDMIPLAEIGTEYHVLATASNTFKMAQYDSNGEFITESGLSIGSAKNIVKTFHADAAFIKVSVGAWSGSLSLTDYCDTISFFVNPKNDVIKNEFLGYHQIVLTKDAYILTPSVGTQNVQTAEASLSGSSCCAISVTKGMAINITGTPIDNSGRRPIMALDSTGKCVYKSEQTTAFDGFEYLAPENGTVVINLVNSPDSLVYTGFKNISAKIQNLIDANANIEASIDDTKEFIGQNDPIAFNEGYYIITPSVGTQNVSTTPAVNNQASCFAVSCSAGDVFTLSGTPIDNSGVRPYMWLNSDNRCVYRSSETSAMVNEIIVAPYDGTLVVNFAKGSPHTVYRGLCSIADRTLENYKKLERIQIAPLSYMPSYIVNDLAYRPLGQLQHPYICLSCDDGATELETYTIPMLLEKNVPCTFGLWASSSKVGAAIPFRPSQVLTTESGRAAVLNAISHGCTVAQHGGIEWTEYDEADLNEFFDREQAAFNALGITVSGAICPSHCINNMVRAVAGGRFGSVRSGYKGYKSKADMQNNIPGDVFDPYEYRCAGARTNVYGYSSFNSNAVSLEYMKSAVDYAIANNLVVMIYWHDWDLTSSQKADLEALIDYAKAQNITFCTLGNIPTLI